LGGSSLQRLHRTARTLGRKSRAGKAGARLPSLWLVTDPDRLPDPLAAAARLPPGAGVIYRAFGRRDALATALALRRVTRARRLILLIGADESLARACRADGVHLPERLASRARALRAKHPRWIITVAAHSGRALRAACRAGADAALLSMVFASTSRSAGRPMGAVRFAGLVRQVDLPVIALGGVNKETAPGLLATRAAGLAAVEGLKP
jgi:thiamine-phosphate pyrophosphorylase